MRDKTRITPFMEKLCKIYTDNVKDRNFALLIGDYYSQKGDPFYLEESRFLVSFEDFVKTRQSGKEDPEQIAGIDEMCASL